MLIAVIPCHNEGQTLAAVVEEAVRHARVIVVDDRSSDDSAAVARAAGAEVVPSRRPGYDGAVHTGLQEAYARGAEQAVTLDADGEHDPSLIPAFAQALSDRVEVVCGCRRQPQRAAERVAAFVARRRWGVRDPLCGMKGYSRGALRRYFAAGAPLLVNMAPLALACAARAPVAELAVRGQARADRPRFGRALKANIAIWRAFAAALRLSAPA